MYARCFSGMRKFPSVPELTGAQVARRVLDSNGLQHVRIERIAGELTDHYDPRDKVLIKLPGPLISVAFDGPGFLFDMGKRKS